jgi:hypothetical protein
MPTDGQLDRWADTHMMKLILTFCNFAIAPKEAVYQVYLKWGGSVFPLMFVIVVVISHAFLII